MKRLCGYYHSQERRSFRGAVELQLVCTCALFSPVARATQQRVFASEFKGPYIKLLTYNHKFGYKRAEINKQMRKFMCMSLGEVQKLWNIACSFRYFNMVSDKLQEVVFRTNLLRRSHPSTQWQNKIFLSSPFQLNLAQRETKKNCSSRHQIDQNRRKSRDNSVPTIEYDVEWSAASQSCSTIKSVVFLEQVVPHCRRLWRRPDERLRLGRTEGSTSAQLHTRIYRQRACVICKPEKQCIPQAFAKESPRDSNRERERQKKEGKY